MGMEVAYKCHFTPLLNIFQLPQGESLHFLGLSKFAYALARQPLAAYPPQLHFIVFLNYFMFLETKLSLLLEILLVL